MTFHRTIVNLNFTHFRRFLFSCLLSLVWASAALAQEGPLVNGTPTEVAAIQKLCALLNQAVAARDANTLQLFGVGDDWHQYTNLQAQTRITHIGVMPTGALVRQNYEVIGTNANGATVSLAAGAHDLWLSRLDDGRFAFTPKRWTAPTDAAFALANAAQ